MNPLFRIPIRLQLIIIVVIVALPAAGIIIYSGVQLRDRSINDARVDTERLVDRIASEQRILVSSARQLVVSLSQLREVKEKNATKVNLILSEILRLHPNFISLSIADRTGNVWASAVPFASPITIYDNRFFKNALLSGQLSSGEFQIDKIIHKPTFNLGYPYKNSRGEIIGVVCAGIALEDYGILLKRTQLPYRAGMVLLDHKGVILFRSNDPEKYIGKFSNPVLFYKMLKGPDSDTSIAVGIPDDPPRQERFVSYQKLRLEGEQSPYMFVRVGIPVESILSPANKQIVKNLLLFFLVLVSALFIAWLVGKRSIADRIALLEKASRRLANGDLRIRVCDLIKGGELGRLGESFDAMAEQLSSREKSLAEKKRLLEELNISLEQRVADAVLDLRDKDQIMISQSRQAAMGEMIGNIAHQWRQPLNTLGLVLQELPIAYGREQLNKESLDNSIDKAMKIIYYMSQTIEDFRNYFKLDKEKRFFNVNQIVSKTLSLIEPSFKALNVIIKVIEIDKAGINGYANEYSQVLLNILLNSRDAFDGNNIDRQCVISITIFNKNDKSVVTVTDNAGGIPEEAMAKIFDPYFTTKGPDKGTGIGLYMARAIIEKNMGGRLTVRNTSDGAEFRIEV